MPAIVRRFLPDGGVVEATSYGSGHINDTYRVALSLPEGIQSYLLQRLNHQVFRRPDLVMANIWEVYRHLAAHSGGDCLLRPIPESTGGLLYQDGQGCYWRMFPFFSGTFSLERAESEEQALLAARTIGRFLAQLSTLDPARVYDTIPHFHDSLHRLSNLRQVVDRDPVRRLAAAAAEAEMILFHSSLFEKIAALPLPRRVVHNDAKLSNVLFYRHSGLPCGLIDWDTIMSGTILSDFGDLVRSAASPVAEDESDFSRVRISISIFSALCRGFVPAIQPVAMAEELDNLVNGVLWITLEQAMRFLTDYLEGDPYYKTRYPEHNLVRTRNQLALFLSMIEELDQLERIVGEARRRD